MKLIMFLSILAVIISTGCKSNKQNSDNFFIFDADERIFTAFAFMNAAGFDGEWRDEGMNPIRVEIREYVKSKLDSAFQKKIKEFHFSRNYGSWCGYADFALLTAGPPNFEISYDSASTKDVRETLNKHEGLSRLLSEFYTTANIKTLWEKYQPVLTAENNKYKPHSQKAVNDILQYCRLKTIIFSEAVRKIHFLVCPQMSYFTAQQNVINGDMYIIHGPSDGKPSPAAFYHEALHEIINPLTEKHSSNVNKYKELLEISSERRNVGYDDWVSIVNESFVRTIDKVLQGKVYNHSADKILQTITDEYKLGFILCLHIYENLSEYEKSNQSLEEYYPVIILNIDIDKEIKRWNDYWANTAANKQQ